MNKRMIGSFYEDMAVNYLNQHGFQILERNYRCSIGEIDIIAKKDNILRFIEVKYRKNADFGLAAEAVSKAKQKKIIRAATWYITEKHLSEQQSFSFDLLAIQGDIINYYFNIFGAM